MPEHKMNTLPIIDEEYPVDLSESICIECDDQGVILRNWQWVPCPVCDGKRKEDKDE